MKSVQIQNMSIFELKELKIKIDAELKIRAEKANSIESNSRIVEMRNLCWH